SHQVSGGTISGGSGCVLSGIATQFLDQLVDIGCWKVCCRNQDGRTLCNHRRRHNIRGTVRRFVQQGTHHNGARGPCKQHISVARGTCYLCTSHRSTGTCLVSHEERLLHLLRKLFCHRARGHVGSLTRRPGHDNLHVLF